MNTSLLKANYVLSLKPQQTQKGKVNYITNKKYSTTTIPPKNKTLFWGPLLIRAGKNHYSGGVH